MGHHSRCWFSISAVALLLGLYLSLSASAAPNGETEPEGDQELTQEQKEQLRIVRLVEWARKNNVGQKKLTEEFFKPIVIGNQKDMVRNRKMWRNLGQQAQVARENDDASAAKKYSALSQLFLEASKQNRSVLQAIESGDSVALRNALALLRRYDNRIQQISGKKITRSWIVLDAIIAQMGRPGGGGGNGAAAGAQQ